jgi:hypothetical protein
MRQPLQDGCCEGGPVRSSGWIVLDPSGAVMRLDHGARNGQSESKTLAMTLLALPQLMEHVKDDFFLSIRDSWRNRKLRSTRTRRRTLRWQSERAQFAGCEKDSRWYGRECRASHLSLKNRIAFSRRFANSWTMRFGSHSAMNGSRWNERRFQFVGHVRAEVSSSCRLRTIFALSHGFLPTDVARLQVLLIRNRFEARCLKGILSMENWFRIG